MNTKPSLILGASLIISSIILGLTLRSPQTQSPGSAAAAAQTGRYQMVGLPGHAFILDTATGRAWEKFAPEGSFETSRFHRIVVQQSEPLLGDVSDAEAAARMLGEHNKALEDQAKKPSTDKK